MGSDMIERVARAIAEEAAMWGDEATRPEVRHALARAAIAAMREPTEAMVEAGASDVIQSPCNTSYEIATDAYRVMIDAALAEGAPKPPNEPA